MKSLIRPRGLVLAVVGTLAALALAETPTARAQQKGFPQPVQQPIQIPGGGTELFRALLDREGIEPVKANEVGGGIVRPDENLIVVVVGTIPGGNDWDESLRWVRQAIAAGGGALIATDNLAAVFPHNRNPGNNPIGWFVGDDVICDPQDGHLNRRECPYAVPVSPDELRNIPARPGPVWSVFRGLNKVATNRPTHLIINNRFQDEYQYPLARLPRSSVINNNNQRFNPPLLFAVGGDGPERWGNRGYSFLAVADSSIFINQMLMEPGTDNLELTLRTIEYLQGPDKARPRTKCLFFENGHVVDKFDGLREAVRPPRPKIPPDAMPNLGPLVGKNQDKLVEAIDGMADQFQKRDALHNMLVGQSGSERERTSAGNWIERALVVGSIFVVFFLLGRLWHARNPQDVPLPPNTGAGVASTGPPGVFERRQKEMVRRNNVYEPVRSLTREFFGTAGAPPNPGPRMPRLEITDEVRKPESLRQALRDMWRLAYGPPTPMSAQRWFELEPYFERLKQAHVDGKWRFVSDEV